LKGSEKGEYPRLHLHEYEGLKVKLVPLVEVVRDSVVFSKLSEMLKSKKLVCIIDFMFYPLCVISVDRMP